MLARGDLTIPKIGGKILMDGLERMIIDGESRDYRDVPVL